MRVLLLSPPNVLEVQPPLGLLYIAAVLEKNGKEVKVIDCPIEGIKFDDIPNLIKREKPDIVGVSVHTPTAIFAYKVLKIAKEVNSNIKTMIGGPHASSMSIECLKEDYIDFVIKSEGEYTTLDLVNTLESGGDLKKVDGLFFKKDGKIIVNTPRYICDINDIPFPARHFVPIEKYPSILLPLKRPETSIMGSRGCPFECTFCSKAVFGRKVRLRDPKKIVDEIEMLHKKYKVNGIFFYDDSFNFNPKWVIQLCDEIIARGLNKLTYKAEVRVNKQFVYKELLDKMKKAGFYLLAFGVESGNQKILNSIKKGITLEEVKRAVKLTKEAGIKTYGFFMMGNLEETAETVEDTIQFTIDANFDYVQFGIAQPYPGTYFYDEAKRRGWLRVDSLEDFILDKRATLVEIPKLPIEFLKKKNKEALKRFYLRPKYILNQMGQAFRSVNDFKFALEGFGWLTKGLLYSNKSENKEKKTTKDWNVIKDSSIDPKTGKSDVQFANLSSSPLGIGKPSIVKDRKEFLKK